MKQELLSKQFSASSVEELLANSSANDDRHSWLLSYLDVFVLIVMLVITLMAIGDYSNPPKNDQPSKYLLTTDNSKPTIKKLATKTSIEASNHDVPKTNKQLKNDKPELSHDNKDVNPISALKESNMDQKLDAPPLTTFSENNSPTDTIDSLVLPMTPIDSRFPASPLPGFINSTLSEPITIQNDSTKKLKHKVDINSQDKLQNYWQQQLNNKLASLNLNEAVSINVQQGYAQIEIQENILFESAKAELTDSGALVLQSLISILKQSAGLIYIEGHTDNQPIHTARFPSNWELGSARATSVLHFLASQALSQKRLRAVTYADTMPIADNITEIGRRKNRRVNILVKMPDNKVDQFQ